MKKKKKEKTTHKNKAQKNPNQEPNHILSTYRFYNEVNMELFVSEEHVTNTLFGFPI